jgi:hypothetical protein
MPPPLNRTAGECKRDALRKCSQERVFQAGSDDPRVVDDPERRQDPTPPLLRTGLESRRHGEPARAHAR